MQVRIWEVAPTGQTIPKHSITHDAPPLCTAWSPDGMQMFSGGGSRQGRLFDLQSGQTIPFCQHDAAIKSAFYFQPAGSMQSILATASWDKTVKYWDARQGTPIGGFQLPERCYSMSVTYPLLVVATAERHVAIVNLQGDPNKIYKSITSPLKFQTRVVSNFSDKNGFAIGTIEGRVAIQYVEDKDSSQNFSFKCHRDGNNVYAINDISFHPTYGTFSTAGSDGTMNFWDKDCKQRLKSFPNCGAPITSNCFNRNGTIFAYAACYDWAKGHEHHRQDEKPKIYLHAVKDEDIAPRAKKR